MTAEKTGEAEVVFPGVFRIPDSKNPGKKLLATRNLTPGRSYYGEKSARAFLEGEVAEFRFWDPFRSKLSASILNGLSQFPIREGASCLYLGASTGTTVSHISDIVGATGKIFAVEMAARVARELLESVVKFRTNVIPVISDARRPDRYGSVYGFARIVYCDIAQPDQTEIAISNCKTLFPDDERAYLFLVVKASSIDALEEKSRVIADQLKTLENAGFETLQKIDLEPYDRKHAMILAAADRSDLR
jgi:fibrillarin-like pre-rRNA processing protein